MPDFADRMCPPHHNEVGLDEDIDTGKISAYVVLEPEQLFKQFKLREIAAIRHIQKLYHEWKRDRSVRKDFVSAEKTECLVETL